MIIYFMKQEALDFMKRNMSTLYIHYFTDSTCDWIEEAYGEEAFSVFKEIPDFELCDMTDKSAGDIDAENIVRLFSALRSLSESQAADERLWAGMCNKVFYSYLRRRWKYDENDIMDAEKDASAVLSRFFFSAGARGSYFRNSLAKYWWVGRLLYDEENEKDPFYGLKAIGSMDLNSKVTEIFYNNTFTSNPAILRAIVDALALFYEEKIYLSERDVLRPTMQYLNAIGGAVLLDALPPKEITKLTVDKINSLLKGSFSALAVLEEEDEEEDEDEGISGGVVPGVVTNIDMVPTLSYDFEEEVTVFVNKGDTVVLFIEDLNKELTKIIPANKEKKDMILVEAMCLGKKVGDTFKVFGHNYIVREIKK